MTAFDAALAESTAEAAENVALAVVEKGTPLPVFGGREMGAAIVAYRDLQQSLDRAMPDQIMRIGDKAYRKKGYWRSIATAFNLKVERVHEERSMLDATADRQSDWGWLVTYRATAPNGRFADGDGACFASEKNRGRMAATEHNVRSHANTRAYNRAISNLVAFGEVSAEEVNRDNAERDASEPRNVTPRGSSYASEAQGKRLYAIAKQAGWKDEELKTFLSEKHGIDSLAHIPRATYDALCKAVEQGAF